MQSVRVRAIQSSNIIIRGIKINLKHDQIIMQIVEENLQLTSVFIGKYIIRMALVEHFEVSANISGSIVAK